jgi:hypothetical protein
VPTRALYAALLTVAFTASGEPMEPYARWSQGPPSDSAHFPIGVWLQAPRNAARYRDIGINFYIGLWKGPTEKQLAELADAGMPVICSQSDIGLTNIDNPTIIGWMHQDEPDNAQSRPDGQGYGPPVAPARVREDYDRWRAADPSRPVLLNLGQGVANDEWRGRGEWGKPEDYPQYGVAADILSYDIYPVASRYQNVHGRLEYVAKGVRRLRTWAREDAVVWNVVEASRISNTDAKVTGPQIRAQVWMSIINGSRGIVYFVHQFEPRFIEASLFEDEELSAAVAEINAEVTSLAAVISSSEGPPDVTAVSSHPEMPVDVLARRSGDATYVFAVAMRDMHADVTFALDGLAAGARVDVLGEERTLTAAGGRFEDAFGGYGVHLYRIEDR